MAQMLAPNDIWCADFKGQFKTGDGIYCYPLTVTDGYSRYLLACQGLPTTSAVEAKPVFIRLFKKYGLPQRIRSDNGVPFATTTLARLSTLSAWWVRLGILPDLIEPWMLMSRDGELGRAAEIRIHAKARFGYGAGLRLQIMMLVEGQLSAAAIPLA